MAFDSKRNALLLFGGGGPNKARFNSVSILDWNSKCWSQLVAPEGESVPWERTYHVAELYYDHLIVFGGEGLTDLDDLWLFNLNTHKWQEVKVPQDEVKPCARRFHTSALLDGKMYVIAGCHTKYRCLNDIYSLDLKPLLQGGNPQQLKWNVCRLPNNSFLTRWGHSSVVFQSRIYIFGGRFSNDLNDILVFDPTACSLRVLKTSPKNLPSARRRHCSVFLGSNLVIFGGFNGEYFNDLHYINIWQSFNCIPALKTKRERYTQWVGKKEYSDRVVISANGDEIHVHTALLQHYFDSPETLESFLLCEAPRQSTEILLQTLTNCYCNNKEGELEELIGSTTELSERRVRQTGGVVTLTPQHYEERVSYLRRTYTDTEIEIGDTVLRANAVKLASNCPYFRKTLTKKRFQIEGFLKELGTPLLMETLKMYLENDVVLVSEEFGSNEWMGLCKLADYLCLLRLVRICEFQLSLTVNEQTSKSLLLFSRQLALPALQLSCFDHELKSLQRLRGKQLEKAMSKFGVDDQRKRAFFLLHRFDIHFQARKEFEGPNFRKSNSSLDEQKENSQVYNR